MLTLLLLVSTASLSHFSGSAYSYSQPAAIITVWFAMIWLIMRGLREHPFDTFGIANTLTALRASGVALLAGAIPLVAHLSDTQNSMGSAMFWGMCLFVSLLLAADGVDGYLARKTRLASNFGARFDMEVDAFLAFVITMILWQSDKLGVWVLGLGVMRYLFVLASVWAVPLQAPLFPSLRRKTVCVIQIAALCLMLSPIVNSKYATAIGIVALLILGASFLRDSIWLFKQRPADAHLPASLPPRN